MKLGPMPTDKSKKIRERIKSRREKWFSENGPCKICGSYEKLELDHIDPRTKDLRLKTHSDAIWSWSDKNRILELSKCQILCFACHVKKSKIDNSVVNYHGSYLGYKDRKCRCEPCVQASMFYKKEYKKSQILEEDGKTVVGIIHGTLESYTNRGCKCLKCLEIWKIYSSNRRKIKKD